MIIRLTALSFCALAISALLMLADHGRATDRQPERPSVSRKTAILPLLDQARPERVFTASFAAG